MADLTLNIISNMSGATAQVNEFTNAMKRATSAVSSTGAAVKKTGSAVSTAADHVAKLGHSANKTAGFFGKLNRSLARIAVYRTMRKAISYVGEAFKTGLEAAYQFSKANQPAEYAKLAGAMDGIRKAASTMSLQLGAAFGGLITAIAPILIRIINLVTAAADAITRFFAVLNGTGYYKKAAEGFEEVGNSAGGAGKKIKGLLASWDELNVIGKESGGGGGGSSATDYSGAYEWVPAQSELATAFLDGNLGKVGEIIGRQLREWGEKIDEWFGKYFGNDYDYWKSGLEGFVDLFSGILRGLGFDAAAYNLELFAEKVKAVFGLISEYTNAFSEAIENSKINIFFLNINKFFTGLERDFKALALSLATDIQNSDVLRKIFGDQSEYIFKLDAEVYDAEEELAKIDKRIEELKESGDNGVNVDAHVDHEKVDQYKETLKKPWAVEIAPQLKEEFTQNISDWLHGTGVGHNDGVYSTGNGLALTLSVIPSLGDRSVFVKDVNEKVTYPRTFAANPGVVPKKVSEFTKYVAGKVLYARSFAANPGVVPKKVSEFTKYVAGKVLYARTFAANPGVVPQKVAEFVKYVAAKVLYARTFAANPGVIPKKVNEFISYITGKVLYARTFAANPGVIPKKVNEFISYITGKVLYARTFAANPDVIPKKVNEFIGYITEKVLYARTFAANPETITKKINEFNQYVKEKVTYSRDFNTNPVLKVLQKYKDAMGDLTEAKTVDIKPELTDAKAFKEQLQSALKASASINTTVSGTTTTIGKVSMSEYAQGGWPNIGDLFIANEAGPELVGTIGGSTAVANNDDIVQGIQGGVERANSEQNELIRQQNSILMQLLNKELTISPSVALGQVMARSAALYGRA